jgi:branched-chain amino acid transport system substrate-binding protein
LTEEDGHRYFFRALSNNVMTTQALVLSLKNRKFRTAWIITYDYAYGHQAVQDTKASMQREVPEIKVLGESYPPLTESDFTSYISQIMNAKPNVVIAYLFGATQAAFVKQAKLYGFFDKIRLATDCNPENIRPIGLDFVKGVLGYAFYDITLDSPHNKKFAKTFFDKYREYPGFCSACFYTGMISLARAVENSGTTDREAVTDALEKITVSSPYGDIYYRPCDHQPSFPVVVGETVLKPGENWYYLGDNTKTLPAKNLWHSCEEVKAQREAVRGKK